MGNLPGSGPAKRPGLPVLLVVVAAAAAAAQSQAWASAVATAAAVYSVMTGIGSGS
ncbi:hypothetical protein AB0D86_47740 [Streptomyces sp. NPDC048324]|uniref:hypothetical protein n=1 Tax=Streptomyces sp. NPDC048324 TaxID=3157205 RepID=UPI003444942A